MDDIYKHSLNQTPVQASGGDGKHTTLMQFNNDDSYTSHLNLSNNNNNENNIFVTSKNSPSTPTSLPTNNNNNNKGSNDHLTGSNSPSHLSSNSSVSSQAQNIDDCDSVVNHNHHHHHNQANNSSPPSPQSSYNSSYGSNSGQKLMNSSNNSVTALVPGGVVTTQNISTVIKPKSNNNSLQFVKIQTPELSKKAVEQIKMAEDSKINKEKIKEVEEEWQSNLLNWKSKRRQQFNYPVDQEPNNPFEANDSLGGRKIKTFAEMIEQRAKSGNRLGFHLQRYIGADEEEDSPLSTTETTEACDEPDRAEIRSNSEYEEPSSPPPPIAPSRNLTKSIEPMLKNETKTNVVLAKSDESDNSGFEDEDGEEEEEEEEEQEEEQKHLQRIAFEAKLKAFERLTKPTPPPAPKFVPNRINRASTTPTSSISPKVDIAPRERQHRQPPPQQQERLQQQQQQHQHQQQLHQQQQQQLLQHQQQQQQLQQQQMQHQQQQQQQMQQQQQLIQQQNQRMQSQPKPQLPSPIKVAESSRPKPTETIHLETKEQQQPNPSETSSPIRPMVSDDRLHSTPNKSISSIHIIDRSPSQKVIDNSIQSVQDSFKQVNIVQKPVPIPVQQPVPQPPPEPIGKFTPKVQHNNNNDFNQVSNVTQKPRTLVNQPLPESPKNVPTQRKLPRDGKDRTVLSVSGKKRCSSCKEELGRGAAAFVVESLSLVYHTNCFKCNVCHVNLSNGFRGVDVRVHAGALHCQNCYSKDGINFSRV